jgi:hypothetical protein
MGSLVLNSSCYHLLTQDEQITLSIPFIKGDKDGMFSKCLTQQIALAGIGEFSSRNTRYEIHVSLSPDQLERIGFRYDREPNGTFKPNIIGTETRKNVVATVELYDLLYDKVVFGPQTFKAQGDFDYVDSDNIADMSFLNSQGQRNLVFSYSLGQLNTIEGAQDAVSASIYTELSKHIVDELAFYFEHSN